MYIVCACSRILPAIDGIIECPCGEKFDLALFDKRGKPLLHHNLRQWSKQAGCWFTANPKEHLKD